MYIFGGSLPVILIVLGLYLLIRYLKKKCGIDGLNNIDIERLNKLQSEMPNAFINDWLRRRQKNFGVNVKLIEYAKEN